MMAHPHEPPAPAADPQPQPVHPEHHPQPSLTADPLAPTSVAPAGSPIAAPTSSAGLPAAPVHAVDTPPSAAASAATASAATTSAATTFATPPLSGTRQLTGYASTSDDSTVQRPNYAPPPVANPIAASSVHNPITSVDSLPAPVANPIAFTDQAISAEHISQSATNAAAAADTSAMNTLTAAASSVKSSSINSHVSGVSSAPQVFTTTSTPVHTSSKPTAAIASASLAPNPLASPSSSQHPRAPSQAQPQSNNHAHFLANKNVQKQPRMMTPQQPHHTPPHLHYQNSQHQTPHPQHVAHSAHTPHSIAQTPIHHGTPGSSGTVTTPSMISNAPTMPPIAAPTQPTPVQHLPTSPIGKVVESGQEHTGRWTKEEHEAFLAALHIYGKEWKKVAARVKTRTVVQTRTHAQKYFQKLQKVMEGGGGQVTGNVGIIPGGGSVTGSIGEDGSAHGSPALTSASMAAMADLGIGTTPASEKKGKGKRGSRSAASSAVVQMQKQQGVNSNHQHQHQQHHHHGQMHHAQQVVRGGPAMQQHLQHQQYAHQHQHQYHQTQSQQPQQQQQPPPPPQQQSLHIMAPQTSAAQSQPSPGMPRTPSATAAAHLMANMSSDKRLSMNNSNASGGTSGPHHGFTTSNLGNTCTFKLDSSVAPPGTSTHGFGYSVGPATTAANIAVEGAISTAPTTSGISIVAPTHEDMVKLGKFPEPSPAACGKRKMAEIAAAQMLAGVVGGGGLGGNVGSTGAAGDSFGNGNVATGNANRRPSVSTSGSAMAAANASLGDSSGLPPLSSSPFLTTEDGRATPPPPPPSKDALGAEEDANESNDLPSFASTTTGMSLQIVNPDTLDKDGPGGSKRRLINGQASPSTPWDGQLEALVSHVKSQDVTVQDAGISHTDGVDQSNCTDQTIESDQLSSPGAPAVTINTPVLPSPLRNPVTNLQTAILNGSMSDVSLICSNPAPGSNSAEVVNERSENGYYPLHSVSALGLLNQFGPTGEEPTTICRLLIDSGAEVNCRDNKGNTPIHWAARAGHCGVLGLLLLKNCPLDAQNEQGETALHWAMRAGYRGMDAVQVLVENGARVNVFSRNFKRPLDVAAEGFVTIEQSLGKDGESTNGNITSAYIDLSERRSTRWNLLKHSSQSRTLVLYHPECRDHAAKSAHDWEVPDRIDTIISTLTSRTTDTCGPHDEQKFKPYEVTVSSDFERATLELLSRIHSAEYLTFVNDLSKELERRRKQQLIEDTQSTSTEQLPEKPMHVVPFTPMVQRKIMKESKAKEDGHSDTSFSAGSLKAARRAAGAVQHAVDCVLVGRNRNAFCVVRPPGHHAGINGLLSNAESCGFCLFNNVAAGAMHALSDEKHRPRCERCAIVDIDAHHGNGTEEIVRKCHDSGRLLFFSVHLYDYDKPKKGVDFQYKFYPGTGAEDDVAHNVINVPIAPLWREREVVKSISTASHSATVTEPRQTRQKSKQAAAAAEAASTVVSPAGPNNGHEDSNHAVSKHSSSASIGSESAASDITQPSKPRQQLATPTQNYPPHYLMGVGRLAYRRAILHRLIPALRAFNPDLIIMSTGFDAARGDVGNARHFVGGTEAMGLDLEPEDYAWTVSKVCEVADICCHGRVVSVLEGGYGRTPQQVPGPPLSDGATPDPTLRRALDKSFFSECAMQHLKGLIDPYAENIQAVNNSSKRKRP